jgi:MerR family transcriptional regulator, redox-sensitive transcriptional activator SoxR
VNVTQFRVAIVLVVATPTPGDWEALSVAWKDRLDERIDQLIRLRDDLANCIGCGCLSLSTCHLANPYDTMSKEGSGARRFLPGSPRPEPAPIKPPVS